ncbi:hypothetical protein [Achromobacter ruhlandii]|uniref:hypothetical protein n=1 Tax=Achromobacter ruhlandii TaxID=72557 RepID=UPI0012E831FF|nr:hypothetical protein [Achromobacter ruhlandii]
MARLLLGRRGCAPHFSTVQLDEAFPVSPLEVSVSAFANVGNPRLGLVSKGFGDSGLRPALGLQIRDEVFPVHAPFNRNCAHHASAIAIGLRITIAI